ncbi:alpha/beta hydrolase [Hymenobacter saemangeumensis]|uniref:Alpha/beta hydrolase n=1 Tax=Hymenobacter saemangeumensis TaxID=1084522 RepID=A0ABP8HZL9_9BACT
MKLTSIARCLPLALFLTGAAIASAIGATPTTELAQPAADSPAAHPLFTVKVVGKGQPMLLIPGLTCPGAVWDETVAHYQKQYQCHVVSLAGFGGQPAVPGASPLLLPVRDQLLAYVKAQKLNQPVVVGHSLGGFLALWMSSTQPNALGPLLILDSLPFMSAIQDPSLTAEKVKPRAEAMRKQMQSGPMPAAARRQMLAGLITDTARISLADRWGVASDPATVGQAMYELSTTDLRADLARIQQPVLVLGAWAAYKAYGSTMESTRAIFAQQYAQLPQHRIEMSEAGRHFLMWDDTAWFFTQADSFLRQARK